MVSFEDALKTVLSYSGRYQLVGERVALSDTLGRILAEDIFSDIDMPPFDKSAVDGYACQMVTEAQNFGPLRIVETIPAGTIPKMTIMPGQCSKIMTGAMVPPGADCVIMVENTELVSENLVRITQKNSAKNI